MEKSTYKFNWYPGHMKKALDAIEERIKYVDVIFMVVDARAYKSGYNHLLHNLAKEKRKQLIIIVSKIDLVPKSFDKKIITNYFKDMKLKSFILSFTGGKRNNILEPIVEAKRILNNRFKDSVNFVPNVMIVGMSNTGKSTYINSLKRKASSKTANIPGVTRRVSLFRVQNLANVIDTPGVLLPEALTEEKALPLHLTKAIAQKIIPLDFAISWALNFLKQNFIKEYTYIVEKFKLTFSDKEIEVSDLYHLSVLEQERIFNYISNECKCVWDI